MMKLHAPTLRLLPIASMCLLSMACDETPPDATSCAPWDQLERPADRSSPLPGEVKVVRAPGQIYPGYYNVGEMKSGLNAFEDRTNGQTPPVVFTFHDWVAHADTAMTVNDVALGDLHTRIEAEDEADFETPAELARRVYDGGAVLALAWVAIDAFATDPLYYLGRDTRRIRHQDILDGTYDDYIRHFATQVKELDVPIMLSPFGEYGAVGHFSYGAEAFSAAGDTDRVCDHYGDPAWPDGPERVRDIYRHVVDLFREQQVTNVTWFYYTSTNYMNTEYDPFTWDHPGYYYPGDNYVDWVGSSGYFAASEEGAGEGIGDIYFALEAGIQAWREITDKPYISPEFGITGPGGEDRSELFAQTFQDDLGALGIDAFALADSTLFEVLFQLPKLGQSDGELDAWNAMMANDAYATTVRYEIAANEP